MCIWRSIIAEVRIRLGGHFNLTDIRPDLRTAPVTACAQPEIAQNAPESEIGPHKIRPNHADWCNCGIIPMFWQSKSTEVATRRISIPAISARSPDSAPARCPAPTSAASQICARRQPLDQARLGVGHISITERQISVWLAAFPLLPPHHSSHHKCFPSAPESFGGSAGPTSWSDCA
jgi:hypothetical protein